MRKKGGQKVVNTDETERMGVNRCEAAFLKIKMVFREQKIGDYGIDAIVETKDEEYYSGKLIGVQIKSGESYFKEEKDGNIVFRIESKHYKYWSNYSIPVIIVLYSPSLDTCIWELFTKDKVIKSGNNWKIEIPRNQTIENSKAIFEEIASNITPYQRRYNSLIVAKEWMEKADENPIILEVQEWINKCSGRGDFILKDYEGKVLFKSSIWGFGTRPYELVLPDLFPWADICVDYDFYTEDYDSDYYNMSIEDKMEEHTIFPYKNAAGEVDFYRLFLSVNELGKSFLLLDEFLNKDESYYWDKIV